MSKVIKGKLDAYFETGTEGVIWSLLEQGKEGYHGLNCLEDGDYLTILDHDNNVIWEGNIDFEYERNYIPFPSNPSYGQQCVRGLWVHGIQKDVDPETWADWFLEGRSALLIKAGFGKLHRCKSSTIVGHCWSGRGSPWNSIKDHGDLIIKFKNSGFYRYKNVDSDTYWAFESAESMGKYFAQFIKNKFEVEKLEMARPARYSTNPPRPWIKYNTD